MKNISSAIFYMSEWQAIFQCEEYSCCEARPYQDKQKNMIGMSASSNVNHSEKGGAWKWVFRRST